MTTTSPGIMDRLRGETRENHTRAETHPLQKALARGTAPRGLYAAYLAQLLFVHRALERALVARRDETPAIGSVLKDRHMREPDLVDDLDFLGLDPASVEPSGATRRLVERIEDLAAAEPVALMGFHYVLEGSTNGGTYIARAVRRGLGIEGERGTRYFDPYGQEQRAVWTQFREDMGSVGFSPAEADMLVGRAREMFDAIYDIADEVWRQGASVHVRSTDGAPV